MTNSNQQLLDWAVNNVKVEDWPATHTQLRSDNSEDPVFFSCGDSWEIDCDDGCWITHGSPDTYFSADFTNPPVVSHAQVISYEEFVKELNKRNFFGKKYHVNPETSDLLQRAVFSSGGSWYSDRLDNHIIQNTEMPYLYVNNVGVISFGVEAKHFDKHPYPEVKLAITKDVKIVEIVERNREKEEIEKQIAEHEEKLMELKAKLEEM